MKAGLDLRKALRKSDIEDMWKEFFSRAKPFPEWFRKLCREEHTMEFGGLKIPKVTIRPKVVGYDSGPIIPGMKRLGRNVGIGFSINGKDIWGWLNSAPEFWDESLTRSTMKTGFEVKLARHMNAKYGRSWKKDPKKAIEGEFDVQCDTK